MIIYDEHDRPLDRKASEGSEGAIEAKAAERISTDVQVTCVITSIPVFACTRVISSVHVIFSTRVITPTGVCSSVAAPLAVWRCGGAVARWRGMCATLLRTSGLPNQGKSWPNGKRTRPLLVRSGSRSIRRLCVIRTACARTAALIHPQPVEVLRNSACPASLDDTIAPTARTLLRPSFYDSDVCAC